MNFLWLMVDRKTEDGNICAHPNGGMAEWSKAPVLKTDESRGSQGSNPCPSAIRMSKVYSSIAQLVEQ